MLTWYRAPACPPGPWLGFPSTVAQPAGPSVRPDETDCFARPGNRNFRPRGGGVCRCPESVTELSPAKLLASAIRDITARLYLPAQLQVRVRRVLSRPARLPALSGG
jgi:hypothetical protein